MSTNSGWPMSKRQDEWKRTSQSPPTMADQCQKRQDEWERTSQSPPTMADQCQKSQDEWKRTSQSPPTMADQYQKRQDEWERRNQWPPTMADQCQKDKTSGSAQVKVHQQWLTNVKKTRRGRAHMSKQWLTSGKRYDEWKRTSQSPPTMLTNVKKDKTNRSAQINDHQQWLTNVKKTRRVGAPKSKSVEAYKSQSTNSDWPMSKRKVEWGSAQVKVY